MNDNLSKIKERIEKLLALSKNNSNRNEAEVAAMKAQELIMQYKLDTALFETNKENIDYELVSLDSRQTAFWKAKLFHVLAKNNFCRSISTKGGYIYLFGKKQDRELVIYLYNNFSKIIENICNNEWKKIQTSYRNITPSFKEFLNKTNNYTEKPNGKTWKHSYYVGLVAGLGSKLEDQLSNMMGNENVYGIIKLSDQLIEEKVNATFKVGLVRSNFNSKVYNQGVEKGKTINNNLALGSGK